MIDKHQQHQTGGRERNGCLHLLTAVFCLMFGSQDGLAQSSKNAPPTDLELAKIEYHRSVLAAAINPLKSYITQLDELIQKSAEDQQYEIAIAAQQERLGIQSELERIAKELLILDSREQSLMTSLIPDRIELPLAAARLDGPQLDSQKNQVTQWTSAGHSASWELPNLPPGGYEVEITYQCGALEGGSVLLAEKSFTLTADLDTTLRGPETKNLGTIKITDGSGPFKMSARSIVKNNLMRLIKVELIPVRR